MATPRLLLFAGAPPASSLDSASCTINDLDDSFSEFLGLAPQRQTPPHFTPQSSQAAWRSLPLTRQPLRTGFSQTHDTSISKHSLANQSEFFTTAEVSFNRQAESFDGTDPEDVLTHFYDHSLAVHNSIPSSQLESFDETSLEETSFMTTSSTGPPATTAAPVPSHLSDLEDIPSASRILALNPQTVTLNIIVGIISIAQPRTVTTRWGRKLSLVEILVGDDTKSGFAVTFWLAHENAAAVEISNLRRQDVVLMQNVALHVFRGKVYGQSLRKGMTKVSLLWRRDGSGLYSTRELAKRAQGHPQLAKTKQVKDWVLKFVGADAGVRTRARTARASWDRPPDDTQ
ncbi:nucleic acid-binding OB-fold [Fusarium albosuccineum]|uniref:Nucleic acid-binding OB-fold n=1 Tax=Fusarium albosuccineum TaxID=1237068 RepID=A0A8H4L6K6_9HYPO|nr:nucleic acid-binding OB-fold [Fusarium albosuccineum]